MTAIKFGIVKKMVLGITAVSAITYGTSAFFIFILQRAFQDYVPSWLFVGVTLGLGVFWTGFLGWLAAKWLVRPLLQLTAAADHAAAGNLRVRIVPSASADELRALGVSFSGMIDNVRNMMDGISTAFKATDTHVDELRAAIGQAALHIEQITVTIEAISRGAEQQESSSETMLASVGRITQATAEIRQQTDSARNLSLDMVSTIDSNRLAIETLIEGMRKLAVAGRQSMHVVRRLEEHANEIGEISGVVGDLAGRTHLLALNASIEAARAGEHGKGFAVVAGEVKKLAEHSANAAEDINRLIGQIQTEIRSAANRFTEQFELADQESVHGEAAAAATDKIGEEAGKAAAIAERIAAMVSIQTGQVEAALNEARSVADVASRISNGAKEVFASTQEQTAVMEEIAASSDLLRDQSASLKRQIGFFKVG